MVIRLVITQLHAESLGSNPVLALDVEPVFNQFEPDILIAWWQGPAFESLLGAAN